MDRCECVIRRSTQATTPASGEWKRTKFAGKSEITLQWKEIFQMKEEMLEQMLREHDEVFQDELGTLKGFQAKIYVDPNTQPKFCKARLIPYAMQMLAEEELKCLVQLGIIEPVQFAEWAAPIVHAGTKE